MASGGSPWRGYALAAIVLIVVLATTNVWNPWPKVWDWINTSEPIAAGASQWQTRIGGSPQNVTIAGTAVIVEYRTSVEAYGLGAGVKLWDNSADWAAVAGEGADAVVVTGKLTDNQATAVWTYRTGILDLHCAKGGDCELTAWDTKGNARWRVGTGGIGFVLDAANPDLPDTNPIGADGIDDNVAGPRDMPDLIGLPDGHSVRVIDTASGKLVQTAQTADDQRIAVAGGRVLTVTGTSADGTCYYGVVATDPPGNGVVWKRDGLNLRTAANGSSCKQDRDPAGGEDVVLGVDPVGKQELIDAHDGRVLWHGAKGEQVLAVDDGSAVIRSADQATLRGFSMATGRIGWSRPAGSGTSAALTPYAVIIVTPKPARVTAISLTDGRVLAEVRTSAKIFAAGPHGMIAVDGRDMAYLPFA
jgi:outer membrane protein assembly factor BamB